MIEDANLNRARANRIASHVRDKLDDKSIKVFYRDEKICFEMDFNSAEHLVKTLDEHEEWSEV